MTESLAHRGPDAHGLVTLDGGKLAFGHRRLAILGLSEAGSQPMVAKNGDCLVFNGEIYNYLEIKRELQSLGYRFGREGMSDTEVLLLGYQVWGHAVVDKLRGMFAFVIFDNSANQLVLARDRLGIKPLYYSLQKSGISFCSELDPLREYTGCSQIDRYALGMFLRYRYVSGPLCIWDDINKLPPGEVWTFNLSDGSRRQYRYWSLIEKARSTDIQSDYQPQELKERIQQSVNLHARSDVPVGVLLSGGLDSSSLSAIFRQCHPDAVINAYSIGFGDARNELPLARSVARKLKLTHFEQQIDSQDLESSLALIADLCGEPLADSSLAPFYELAKFASKDVKVVFGGDGGDELFYGYKWYWADRLSRWCPSLPHLPAGILQGLRPPMDMLCDAISRKGQDRLDVLHGYPFTKAEARELTGIDDVPGAPGYEPDLPPLLRFRVYDLQSFTVDSILTKVDIASMAHGLEVRVPFLDHELLEYALRLPPSALYKGRLTKRGLREVMQHDLPPSVLTGGKVGFSFPLRAWQSQVMLLATKYLLDGVAVSSGLLKRGAVHQIVNGQARAKLVKVWTLLVLEFWLRRRTSWQ